MNLQKKYHELLPATVNGNINEPTSWVFFDDDLTTNLGPDPDGTRFQKIAELVRTANYYPKHVVEFYTDSGELSIGKRVLQIAPLTPLGFPKLYSMVEISDLEITPTSITVGYFTTTKHFAKGWWKAEFKRENNQITLRVRSLALPNSLLYWLGIPFARYLQLRARREAIKRFQSI